MATVVLGAAGAAVGSMFGNPQLGFSLGVLLAGVLFPPSFPAQERGKLDDLRVTSSAYGVMIPIVYGTVKVGGNIIWATDLEEHVSEQKEGGKGGGGGVTVRTYTYSVSMAVAVAEGPITGIRRIWAEDVLLYEEGVTEFTIRVYAGTETQTADPLIAGIEGAANTPAYRGTAYVVFEDLDLTQWGNRIPQLSFEVSRLLQ